MNANCIFCKILDGTIASDRIHEDERCIAFRDINPQAPLHALVIPREHISTTNDLTAEHDALVGHLHRVAARIARDQGYAERGFRTLMNCNREAGQTVFHIHLHVLAGRFLGWPPG